MNQGRMSIAVHVAGPPARSWSRSSVAVGASGSLGGGASPWRWARVRRHGERVLARDRMPVARDDLPQHRDDSGCLARERLRQHGVGDDRCAIGERRARGIRHRHFARTRVGGEHPAEGQRELRGKGVRRRSATPGRRRAARRGPARGWRRRQRMRRPGALRRSRRRRRVRDAAQPAICEFCVTTRGGAYPGLLWRTCPEYHGDQRSGTSATHDVTLSRRGSRWTR